MFFLGFLGRKQPERPRNPGIAERIGRSFEDTPSRGEVWLRMGDIMSNIQEYRSLEVTITPSNLQTFEEGFLYLFLKSKIENLANLNEEQQRLVENIKEKMKSDLKSSFEALISHRQAGFFSRKDVPQNLISYLNTLITQENKIINFNFNEEIIKNIFQVEFPPTEEDLEKLKMFGLNYDNTYGFYFKIESEELGRLILNLRKELNLRAIQNQEILERIKNLRNLRKQAKSIGAKELKKGINNLIGGLEVTLRVLDETGTLDENLIGKIDEQIKQFEEAIKGIRDSLDKNDEKGAKEKLKNIANGLGDFLKNLGTMALVGGLLWGVFFAFFLPVYFVEKVKSEIKL